MDNDSKELILFRKSFLKKIKEKLEDRKQRLIENNIDPNWAKAFAEANKDIYVKTEESDNDSYFGDDFVDYYSEDEETLDIDVSKITINDFDIPESMMKDGKTKKQDNTLNSSDSLKNAYEKIKKGEQSSDLYSDSDLLKIYAIMLEELRMKSELVDDEEIKELEAENEKLRKEIKKMEDDNN